MWCLIFWEVKKKLIFATKVWIPYLCLRNTRAIILRNQHETNLGEQDVVFLAALSARLTEKS